MVRFQSSIGMRLMLLMSVFVAIIVTIAVVSAVMLTMLDRDTEAQEHKWFTSNRILGELADRVSEFRIAETYRALNTNPATLQDDEAAATVHRNVIESLQQDYAAIMGDAEAAKDLAGFRTAWRAYTTAHDAWLRADPDGKADAPALRGSSLHLLYRSADNAVDDLMGTNLAAAEAEHEGNDQLIEGTVRIMIAASIAALLLGAVVLIRIRRNITRPLREITKSLTRLAAGDRDVVVPALNRTDEIGEMAKAFDVFLGNAVALETAHAETQTAQEQAQALARHDALTGLPNRRVFAAELGTALAHADAGTSVASVMIIDLDRFKPVNDLHGHAVGDLVLCEVANRLNRSVRKGDTVARLGGDEFAVVGESLASAYPDSIIRLAGRVLSAVREPIIVGDASIEIGASIGIASSPGDGKDPDGLIRAADIAMYRAKHDGRGSFHFFEQKMDEELRAQASLEAELRTAVAEGEIKPFYQPLIEMRDSRIYGFEVLARWRRHSGQQVGPDVFIPLAEQLGLIANLTSSILRQACRDAAKWDKDIQMSVNISPVQLRDATLPMRILTILNQEEFPPSRLEVEITEAALVTDLETAKQILTTLQAVGIKISLDDFGTGYSSLYHLRQFKFDKLKIDRSFVQSMTESRESEKIVDAIMGLARSISLPTVAEGIESSAVLQQLAGKGCEFGQGFYFGKAMSAADAAILLGKQAGLAEAI